MNYSEFYVKAITLGESNETYKLYMVSTDGLFAIVIIIGYYEAQLIAIAADKLQKTKRPLTHELFVNYMKKLAQRVEKVQIYHLETGTFYAEVLVQDADTGESLFTLDSRLSDAIALALRFDAPIYVADQVVEGAAVSLKEMEDQNILEVNGSEIKAPDTRSMVEDEEDEWLEYEDFAMDNEENEFSNFSDADLLEMRKDAEEMNINELIQKINIELLKRNINFE